MLPEMICTPPCNECCVQQSSFLLDTNCTPKHNSEDAYKTLSLYQTLNQRVTCRIKISYLQKMYHILLTVRFVRSMCIDQFLSISCLTSVCQGSALEDTGIKRNKNEDNFRQLWSSLGCLSPPSRQEIRIKNIMDLWKHCLSVSMSGKPYICLP